MLDKFIFQAYLENSSEYHGGFLTNKWGQALTERLRDSIISSHTNYGVQDMVTGFKSLTSISEQHASEQVYAELSDPMISQKQVALLLGVSRSTMCRWKRNGAGPTACKFGGRVKYRSSEVIGYIENCSSETHIGGGSDE